MRINPYFESDDKNFNIYQGNCIDFMSHFQDNSMDMIFADPPYFLSNGGLTVKNGIIQSVNKGDWDKNDNIENIDNFNNEWIRQARKLLKDNGTIWISGTHHNIFTVGQVLKENNFKILNIITWEKPNPPPNFSCRYFTYSSEWIIWAKKHSKIPHYFNYDLMKKIKWRQTAKRCMAIACGGQLGKGTG